MKKVISIIVIAAIVVACGTPVFADEYNPIKKLGRGLWNTLTAVGEIPTSVMEDRGGSGMIAGKTHGLIEGIGRFFVKTIAGAVEIVTFPLPFPNENKPILDSTESFKPKGPGN